MHYRQSSANGPVRFLRLRPDTQTRAEAALQRGNPRLRLLYYAVRRIGIAVHHTLVSRTRLEGIPRFGIDVTQNDERLPEPVRVRRIPVGEGIYELLDTGIFPGGPRSLDYAIGSLRPFRSGYVAAEPFVKRQRLAIATRRLNTEAFA